MSGTVVGLTGLLGELGAGRRLVAWTLAGDFLARGNQSRCRRSAMITAHDDMSRGCLQTSAGHPVPHGFRKAVFRSIRWSGVPWLLRSTVQRRRVTIILYHDPSPETMDSHLNALATRYRFVSLPQVVAALVDGVERLPDRSLLVTLDDGHAGNFELRRVFRRHGVRPTVFVCTGLIGTRRGFWFRHAEDTDALKKLPDDERIRKLAAEGFLVDAPHRSREALSRTEVLEFASVADIQAHTVTHPILTNCTTAKARDEIRQAKHDLEELGLDAYALAYPDGAHDDAVVALVRDAGYRCAFAAGGGTSDSRTDPYRLRRIPIDDLDGVDELLVKASGAWRRVARVLRWWLAHRPSAARPDAERNERTMTSHGD